MKILMQNLEDKESLLKKDILKSINLNQHTAMKKLTKSNTEATSNTNTIANQSKIKKINFLYFSNLNNKYLDGVSDITAEDGSTNTKLVSRNVNVADTLLLSSAHENSATGESESGSKLTKNSSFLSLNDSYSKEKSTNLSNFKNTFNTLSKLNKSINIFNGNYLNIDKSYLEHFVSFFNVHASMNDLNDLVYNYTNSNSDASNERKTTTVSLCSNIFESDASNSKPFGCQNHSTMLFEHNNVKIGFMALVDKAIFDKLNHFLNKFNANNLDFVTKQIEYLDFVAEANRLSAQLRLSGAQIIICLTNFESELDEQRLLNEAPQLDIIFSSNSSGNSTDRLGYTTINNRWLVKSSNNLESLSLVTVSLDEFNSNKLVDIGITKYYID